MRLSDYILANRAKFEFTEDKDLSVYANIQINIDKEMDNYVSDVRRPYYRLRGKPVTEEQAFEIIRRTDVFFDWEMKLPTDSDYIRTYHLNNYWFNRDHIPSDMGWIHRDGTLGGNGITNTYPEFKELLFEMFKLIQAFPYLDFVLAITIWDEMTNEMHKHLSDNKYNAFLRVEQDIEFDKAIEIGFWVHNNTIDVLNPERAAEKFKEYEEKYRVADTKYYSSYYNSINNIIPCDVDYLKRCIKAYGLNAEETLGKVNEYIWNPERKV